MLHRYSLKYTNLEAPVWNFAMFTSVSGDKQSLLRIVIDVKFTVNRLRCK